MTNVSDPSLQTSPELPGHESPDAAVEFLLHSATVMDGFTAQMRRAFDMNAHERLAIAGLWAKGPMTMTELGSWIPLSRAAVTTLVDRLEASGFVVRGSDPLDRRRTVVTVDQKSLRRMVPVIQPWWDDLADVIRGLDPAEWATIANFMVRVNEVSGEHAGRLMQMSDDEIQALASEQA